MAQLGNFTGWSRDGKAVVVRSDPAAVRFVFYRDDVLRVDFFPAPSTWFDSSFTIVQDTSRAFAPGVDENDSTFTLNSGAITVRCAKTPLRITYLDAKGKRLLTEGANGGFTSAGVLRSVSFALDPADHFYGTGERGTALDLRGLGFDSYNLQVGGYSSPAPTMKINVPFVASPRGYGLYMENTYPGRWDFGEAWQDQFSYTAYGGELSYVLFTAPDVASLLEAYTWLTGRQPLPPRWALGYIQSKFGYESDAEVRSLAQTFRTKGIPLDAIILDLYWFSSMGDLQWRTSGFPSPFTMMADLLQMGVRTILITEPYITQSSSNYAAAQSGGYVARTYSGQPYVLSDWWSCGCNALLVDMTNPSAQSWWWGKHPAFFGGHLAGIWTDLGEPERHPTDMVHFLGSASKVHNIYNLLWAKTIFEGFSQFRPDTRIFNLTRSGYAGIQRYGVVPWSGDVAKTFGGLASQLPMLLSMGMSGLAYYNSDIGGFCCGTTTPELYVRWMEYGTFCPITRAHGVRAQPTEPWGFGPEAESICKKYIALRYQLLPYITTMAWQNHSRGLPLARPLFFADPNDETLWNESSSYLWGDAFLVSPVVAAGQTTKDVRLPYGRWINYWTDEVVEGGQSVTTAAPLETLPLYVKAGSIVPMSPAMNYTDEKPGGTIILSTYPEPGTTNHCTVYEDDGGSLQYQMGAYALIDIQQTMGGAGHGNDFTLTIGAPSGTYKGAPATRSYMADVHGIAQSPTAVLKNGDPLSEASTYEEFRKQQEIFWHDASVRRLSIKVQTVAESSLVLIAEGVVGTGVVSEPTGPLVFGLSQNYPNPFNPSTQIEYTIPVQEYVDLRVFDLLGREIAVLVAEARAPGTYTVQWEPKNIAGGVYLCRMRSGDHVSTRKLVVIR
jgi:alpha-glucosidase (family GH31 glycosyl hydrolase)